MILNPEEEEPMMESIYKEQEEASPSGREIYKPIVGVTHPYHTNKRIDYLVSNTLAAFLMHLFIVHGPLSEEEIVHLTAPHLGQLRKPNGEEYVNEVGRTVHVYLKGLPCFLFEDGKWQLQERECSFFLTSERGRFFRVRQECMNLELKGMLDGSQEELPEVQQRAREIFEAMERWQQQPKRKQMTMEQVLAFYKYMDEASQALTQDHIKDIHYSPLQRIKESKESDLQQFLQKDEKFHGMMEVYCLLRPLLIDDGSSAEAAQKASRVQKMSCQFKDLNEKMSYIDDALGYLVRNISSGPQQREQQKEQPKEGVMGQQHRQRVFDVVRQQRNQQYGQNLLTGMVPSYTGVVPCSANFSLGHR